MGIGVTTAGQSNKARTARMRGAGGHAPIGRWNVRHMRHPIVVAAHGFQPYGDAWRSAWSGVEVDGPLQPISSHDPPATRNGSRATMTPHSTEHAMRPPAKPQQLHTIMLAL
jgi:hypothetical protein